jgi:V8-like Glu-specific endopeptidase
MLVDILNHVRSNVCAIGYMEKKMSPEVKVDVVKDHVIVGTGFLISKNRIITNRHVLDHLRKTIDSDHWTVSQQPNQ